MAVSRTFITDGLASKEFTSFAPATAVRNACTSRCTWGVLASFAIAAVWFFSARVSADRALPAEDPDELEE